MEYNVSNADRLGECTRAVGLFCIRVLFIEKAPGILTSETKDALAQKA